jgi:allantoicase
MPEVRFDAAFRGLVDLAAAAHGGRALAASDEFFAAKENLLEPGRGVFLPDEYTDRGKWMDGWESRRRRTPGFDWCVIQLGAPGVIRGVDIDTNHFLGNHPPYAALDGAGEWGVGNGEEPEWVEILAKAPLQAGSQNLFAIASEERWEYLRLRIYPDGGVARLKVWGEPRPRLDPGAALDLAALVNGGSAVACSDMFFGRLDNLIAPGRPVNMGGGWETKRRRGPGFDWAVVRLAGVGRLETVEIDTCHFKGNYPDRASLEGCLAGRRLDLLDLHEAPWVPVLPSQPLGPDTIFRYQQQLVADGPFDHVRLRIDPDGGVARLRCFGRLVS